MTLPANLFSTSFHRQKLGAMLAFLIGSMVFLGSLAMAAQAVLVRTARVWEHDAQNRWTMEVLPQAGESSAQREQRVQKAIDLLQGKKGLVEVEAVSEEETARLLKPWIADPGLLESLALPRLVDLEVAPHGGLKIETLTRELSVAIGEVRLHRHEQGLSQLLGLLKGLGFLAAAMFILTAVSVVSIIAVICRAAMALQKETIELLHFMGATDSVIAAQFQAHVRQLAWPAALVGFLLAVVSVAGLAAALGVFGGLSLVAPVSWVTVGGVMALVPVVTTGLAIATARISVQRLLRRLG